MRITALFILALAPVAAFGSTLIGNPNTGVVLVAGNDITVVAVDAHRCGSGTQTVGIDTTLSKGQSASFAVDEDEFCSIVVRLRWSPAGPVVTVPVGGFSTFKSESSGSTVSIDVNASTQIATLQ